MPKMKTHRATAKRVKRTATGKFKREQAYHRHIAEKKSPRRKRRLNKQVLVAKPDARKIKRLLRS
jgi:large subunit ribosomal protein L35